MSRHTITRIANVLESQFSSVIDMSDYQGHSPDEQRNKLLSRALAALSIKSFCDVEPSVAAQAVTDGYQDGGLDAVYFDQRSDTLYMVQSKWSNSGDKTPDTAAVGSFVSGIEDLLAPNFDRFNARILAKEPEVRAALYSERPIKLRFILTHVASQPTPAYVSRKLDDLVAQLNDPVSIARAEYFDQAGVYALITASSTPKKISIQAGLRDFGQIDKPFLGYYGRVHVQEVASWWKEHENRLLDQNLRLFYKSSAVNDALRSTLVEHPEYFWYFNNGITVICDTITKNLAGSPGTKFGVFTCDGVSIVNGAQTVGTIGEADPKGASDLAADKDPQSWVQMRIISLESCPPDFGRRITRAANLQNAVGYREFAAMDPQQHRLATEFALDRKKYAYKSGESEPRGNEGCGINEATQALGCAHSVGVAVQIKKEIGTIWANTETAPYIDLFNDDSTSEVVWRAVLVARAVDDELQRLRSDPSPRADMIAVHMNRIILYLVFQDPVVKRSRKDKSDESLLTDEARSATGPVFFKVARYLEMHHSTDYLASLSKNQSKCEALVESVQNPERTRITRGHPDLFTPDGGV